LRKALEYDRADREHAEGVLCGKTGPYVKGKLTRAISEQVASMLDEGTNMSEAFAILAADMARAAAGSAGYAHKWGR
jgi:type II secretory pathway component PulF